MPSNAAPAAQGAALHQLVSALRLERLEDNLFRGPRASIGWQRVYGGQVLGQALSAACQTVEEDRAIHSLHGYFLLAGDPGHDIIYDVERIRDGGSFATRRVKAVQHGRAIFTMSASFHKREEGFEHQMEMPDVPPPESLPSARDLMAALAPELPENMRAYWLRENPIEMRIVDPTRYTSRDARPAHQSVWMRANGRLPSEPQIHYAMLAYASDFTLLDTALIRHGKMLFDRDVQLASLDHAMWFHRPFKADDWLLYAQESPSASGARGFCRGLVFDRQGRLVASTAQEGLMRRRTTSFEIK
ncbi:MAG: acyl-CoA thioesterase II [Hyphomicrobium sp.]